MVNPLRESSDFRIKTFLSPGGRRLSVKKKSSKRNNLLSNNESSLEPTSSEESSASYMRVAEERTFSKSNLVNKAMNRLLE